MMKKWLLGCGLASVCIGLVAWSGVSRADENGLRQVGQSAKMIDIEYIKGQAGQPPLNPGFESFSDHLSGAFPFETTGFEADAGDGGWCPGYVCGPDFASCNVKVTGNLADTCGVGNPNPQRFWMSGSSRSCSEPHIDTVNPYSGSQHLRYQVDNATDGKGDITPFPCPSGGAGTLTGSCRLSLFSPVICADPATCSNDTTGGGCCTTPLGIAPATMTAWVAKASPISHYLEISTQTPITSGFAGSKIAWDTDFGTLLIYVPGTGDVDTGVYYATGSVYKEMVQVIDVCNLQYVYYYDRDKNGDLIQIGTGPITSGLPTGIEQYVILTDNSAGVVDIDDIEVVRDPSTSPCDSTCGNGVQELGEDCDGDDLGTDCVSCEGDCTCSPRICEFPGFSCPLSNGDNGPYVSAGGWWVYDSDTPAFAVNTCGSEGVDTFLAMWSLSAFGLGFEQGDDDCDGGAKTQGFEADSDPLASCYNRAGPVCVCTGATCTNEDVECPTGDVDCLTINLCFGGGNDGGQCNIGNENDDCTDFCIGGLNAGQDCSADPATGPSTCATLTCVSGPFSGTSCTAEGTATDDCSGFVCTGCTDPGESCNAPVAGGPSDCGGVSGDCQQRDGDCAVAGSCSSGGSCLPDSFCSGDIDTPFESCLCLDYSFYWGLYYYYYNDYDPSFFYTTKGTTWLISLDYFGALPIGSTININIEKRAECSSDPASIIDVGICCDSFADVCVDAGTQGASVCTGDQVFIPNKFCNVNPAGIRSACPRIDGACCNSISGTCANNELRDDCALLTQSTWTQGADCTEVSCFAAGGSCCDSGNGMPGAASCDSTILADCQCDTCTWTKGGNCADLKAEGLCLVNPIPTVSEWGLVILTLLLLTGAKIYFGRRRVATA
ncbi:MAG: IPTL-CTERM sorting domain-containing protein [Planctomycetes bacterium]|nr:IPTL-CTERM sorting domain-containing protein [Planctomycetota bacterium]